MSFDLFQSRRNYNERCKWWSRDERDEYTSDELVMKRVPSGEFMAKEVAPEQLQNLVIANSFMFDKANTTIKSPDDLSGIKNMDLVLYQGEKWIVTNVQKVKSKIQNTTFARDNHCCHFWYVELRK